MHKESESPAARSTTSSSVSLHNELLRLVVLLQKLMLGIGGATAVILLGVLLVGAIWRRFVVVIIARSGIRGLTLSALKRLGLIGVRWWIVSAPEA